MDPGIIIDSCGTLAWTLVHEEFWPLSQFLKNQTRWEEVHLKFRFVSIWQ